LRTFAQTGYRRIMVNHEPPAPLDPGLLGGTSAAMTAFLELDGLTRRHGGRAALDGVGLSVAAGEFVALVGPSGSGKTTLLKSINRLVEPDEGTIRIDGRDVRDVPLAALRHGIGYVIQSIGLFPHMNVAENIGIVPRLMGQEADRTAELLDLVALPAEMAARYPRELSGGQAQRVGFARALAAGPRLMLMDEPFGALDPVTRDALGQAYRALHDRLGLTTLMVTHDVAEALLLADRIVVLIDGRVRADAAPSALMTADDPDVRAMIDVPRRQAARLAAL
jgi:osmoprotectant transport system ATP-binding protein